LRELAVDFDPGNSVVRGIAVREVKFAVKVDLHQRAHMRLLGLMQLLVIPPACAPTIQQLIEGIANNGGEHLAAGIQPASGLQPGAWFDGLEIDEDETAVRVSGTGRSDLLEAIRTAPVRPEEDGSDEKRGSRDGYRVVGQVRGSNVVCLVELRGIEPRTSSLRTKRATNCATAP
jgi:hypothetical protein